MRNDVYRLMVLAVACNLSCDEAYEMLHQNFIDDFTASYSKIPDSDPNKPTVLDALITFTMWELPIRTGIDTNIVYELKAKRGEIVETFIHQDLPTMITMLARRGIVLEEIRKFLRRKNKLRSMYSMIQSTRVDSVFVMFLDVFKKNCAHAFQFDGEFIRFVMNCFQEYFYRGRSIDIWAMIREVDTTKREVEKNVVEEKVLSVKRYDDLPIHDLLVNISSVNNLMFMHPGQSEDVYGVQYDIYYLVLCMLCRAEVERINQELGQELLVFVDPLDRNDGSVGLGYNRGLGFKISNSQAIVSYIFDYIRAGKLNTVNIVDLRDKCFTLGKANNEGRNCIWKNVKGGSETSRYLDDEVLASENYDHFDQVLKGVISVYTLMTEIESRGMSLVGSYNSELFLNNDIIRYMDYLSSVEYLPLIKRLQQEPVDLSRYSKNLLEFGDMVKAYAGSDVNHRANIRENRYYAIIHGFLTKPKLKQSTIPVSRFEVLSGLAQTLDAIPRGYKDYLDFMDPHLRETFGDTTYVSIRSSDVVGRRYRSLYSNIFLAQDPEKAKYYLMGMNDSVAAKAVDDLSWRVGTSLYESLEFAGAIGMYIPLENAFFFFGYDEPSEPFLATMNEVKQIYYQSFVNGVPTQKVVLLNVPLVPVGMFAKHKGKLDRSIGFPWEVGFKNLGQVDVLNRLDAMPVYGQMVSYARTFYSWLDENSRLQHSMIDLLKVMFSEAVFLTSGADIVKTARVEEVKLYRSILDGLLTGEFDGDALNTVLNRLDGMAKLETVDCSVSGFSYRPIDRVALDYAFGRVTIPTDEKERRRVQVYEDLVTVLKEGKDPAERFAIMYNHVYTKLKFLRLLRDSLNLLVDAMKCDASTLACELNQRFKVTATLNEFRQSPIDYGIFVTGMNQMAVKAQIYTYRDMCLRKFRYLIGELVDYVREAEDELAKLISYDVVAQDVVSSRFEEFGRAFQLLPAYQGIPELDVLRKKASIDSAGFFLYNGTYFKGRNSNKQYYVHRSGRMVMETADGWCPVDFSLVPGSDDYNLYLDIIRKGYEASGR